MVATRDPSLTIVDGSTTYTLPFSMKNGARELLIEAHTTQMSRPAYENSPALKPIPFRHSLFPITGGMATDKQDNPSGYAKGNADTSYSNLLIPPPLHTAVTLTNATTPNKCVEFCGQMFILGGRYMYYITTTSIGSGPVGHTAVEDKDFGASKAAVDMTVFNGELIVAMGESEKIWKRSKGINISGSANAAVTSTDTTLVDTRLALEVNAYVGATVTCNSKTMVVTSNTATELTGASWSGGGNPGNGKSWTAVGTWTQATDATYAIALGVVDSKLWRAETVNQLSNCITAPLTLTSWTPSSGDEHTVGDTTYPVNTIIDYQGGIWAGCADGMYAADPTYTFHNQTPQLKQWSHVNNCFPEDTKVSWDKGLQKIFRRWYEGPMVKVTTASGYELSGTPNHPILTNLGWKALGLLVEGDSIICSGFRKGMSFSNPNIENMNTSIGEIFNLLSLKGARSQRESGTPIDFHGDGSHSDVDVIAANGLLWSDALTLLGKPIDQNSLISSNKVFSLLSCKSSLSKFLTTRSNSFSRTMRGACQGKTLLGREARLVKAKAFAGGSDLDSSFPESSADREFGDTILTSDSGVAQPHQIVIDEIVGIHRESFAGHVFNLETDLGLYGANDIIAHNCKGAFTAHGSLWVPSAVGLLRIKIGLSVVQGPEIVNRPDYRFWVRGGVEIGGNIYLLCNDEATTENTVVIKMIRNPNDANVYTYHEWCRLGGTTVGYFIGVTTKSVPAEIYVGYGNNAKYINLASGGGRDIDDGNHNYGLASVLEFGRKMLGPDFGVVATVQGVETVCKLRTDDSLTISLKMDGGSYVDLLTTQEGGSGTAAIPGPTTNYQSIIRYAVTSSVGQFAEVKITGTHAAGNGTDRTEILDCFIFGQLRPLVTDVLVAGLVCDGATINGLGVYPGVSAMDLHRIFSGWMAGSTVLELQLANYQENKTTRFMVADVQLEEVANEPGEGQGSNPFSKLTVTFVRTLYGPDYGSA